MEHTCGSSSDRRSGDTPRSWLGPPRSRGASGLGRRSSASWTAPPASPSVAAAGLLEVAPRWRDQTPPPCTAPSVRSAWSFSAAEHGPRGLECSTVIEHFIGGAFPFPQIRVCPRGYARKSSRSRRFERGIFPRRHTRPRPASTRISPHFGQYISNLCPSHGLVPRFVALEVLLGVLLGGVYSWPGGLAGCQVDVAVALLVSHVDCH